MRLRFVLVVFILATVSLAQTPSGPQNPLDKDQVMSLVAAGMDDEQLAKTVQQRGIDFEPTDDYVEALRKAGARDVLVKALRADRRHGKIADQGWSAPASVICNHDCAIELTCPGGSLC